ncbi:MAG: YlxR family protein [Candidatus Nanopelagicales bacterium]|nr:YlxR family protein [Candidatus Nanopelagicales bacterium]
MTSALDSASSVQHGEPTRTCIGFRVTARDGLCLPDPRSRQPGRGAYLHPTVGCLDLAERRRAFPRALRVQGALDIAQVRAWIEAGTATER